MTKTELITENKHAFRKDNLKKEQFIQCAVDILGLKTEAVIELIALPYIFV